MNIIVPFQPTLFPSLYVFNRASYANVFIMMLSAQFCAANKKEDGNKGKTGQRHIKIAGKKQEDWLSVPIVKELQPIRSTYLKPSTIWRDNFISELSERYIDAPFFKTYINEVKNIIYKNTTIAGLNEDCFRWGHELFEIRCKIVDDIDVTIPKKGNDWVFDMVNYFQDGNTTLLTGKPSLNYLDVDRYKNSGLHVAVQNWTCSPYQQIDNKWISGLSMLDALFFIGHKKTKELINSNGQLDFIA